MNNILYDLGLVMSFAFEDVSDHTPAAQNDSPVIWDVSLVTHGKPAVAEKGARSPIDKGASVLTRDLH